MRIMVVGGNGFVGTKLIERLTSFGHTVFAFVEKTPEKQFAGCEYFYGDISEMGSIARAMKGLRIDCVIHNAAISHPGLCKDNPYKMYHVNVEGTLNVCEACILANVKKLIYISSGAVYGNRRFEKVTEDISLLAKNPYAASKIAGEEIVKNYNLDAVVLRLGIVYGPGRVQPEPIKLLLTDAVKKKRIEWKSGIDQRCDYIYIDDCVDAIMAAALKEKHSYDTYNVSGGREISFETIVQTLEDSEPGLFIKVGEGSLGYDNHGPFDISRMKEDYGWEPEISVEEGVRSYYNYLITHTD